MNLETHLHELSAPEAAAFRTLVERLKALPQREPSAGLADRILAAADPEPPHRSGGVFRRPCWPWWGTVAAALAAGVLVIVTRFLPAGPSQPAHPEENGAAWLAANQETDGTWDPARHGGIAVYRPALTALSALALSRGQDGYSESVGRACAALAALQTPDGAFGGQGRALYYNQAITTYALAALYPQRPALKPVLDRAIGFIKARQTVEGGWDYQTGSEGNAAITSWQVQALSSAADQGFSTAAIPLRKGLRWLRGTTRDDGSVAYHRRSTSCSDSLTALTAYALITAGKAYPDLPALGRHAACSLRAETGPRTGADCYRDYAKIMAFEAAGANRQADRVRDGMLKRQADGENDQWGAVGGKLYTTAFIELASK